MKVFHIQNVDAQRAEFEAAGFTDFDAKLKAWINSYEHEGDSGEVVAAGLPIYFSAPPVYTGNWNTQSWLRFVDWTLPANKKALDHAREELGR